MILDGHFEPLDGNTSFSRVYFLNGKTWLIMIWFVTLSLSLKLFTLNHASFSLALVIVEYINVHDHTS